MLSNELIKDLLGRILEEVRDTLQKSDNAALTWRPYGGGNTIGWLIWHLARIQDAQIAQLAGFQEVWDQGWRERFDLPFEPSATGYGQTKQQVAAVKVPAELLGGYLEATTRASLDYVASLTEADYEQVIRTRGLPPVTKAVRLVSIISDDLQHSGQAAYIQGLYGLWLAGK